MDGIMRSSKENIQESQKEIGGDGKFVSIKECYRLTYEIFETSAF